MNKQKQSLVAAARCALKARVAEKTLSYSSYGTLIDRWRIFVDFLIERSYPLKQKSITREMVIEFGKHLTQNKPAYAQNLVSAVNTTMKTLRQGDWSSVSPTRDCEISRRCNIRMVAPSGLNEEQFEESLEQLNRVGLVRGAVIVRAARSMGLREKEACLLNYQQALKQTESGISIDLHVGTKGGRPRSITITNPDEQIAILQAGAALQGDHFSLIPKDLSWKNFLDNEIHKTISNLKKFSIASIRDLRAVYACNRYETITGEPAPVLGGFASKELDNKARKIISKELGHARLNITNSYIGKHRNVK
ncbi:integrase domain-containing protein [Marinobacter sp. DY40_1A1]|uniref:integrase domain-containing protein n=1 Tax=Marinobacter sp. DY40_1A1 TaxID=2583229 RepID=UPI00190427FC|nr:integrase domain-containing protein [Marinobacter sp. DY40_1A1]MBK1885629.1 integrase domain-containing protein [Marinobacter sp. DY40_1A1]